MRSPPRSPLAPTRVVILDQAGWHGARDLKIPSNISLLPLPPRSPELNSQENIWQFIRQNWLSNRIFQSFDDIVDHCCDAWNALIEQPWKIMSIAWPRAGSRPGADSSAQGCRGGPTAGPARQVKPEEIVVKLGISRALVFRVLKDRRDAANGLLITHGSMCSPEGIYHVAEEVSAGASSRARRAVASGEAETVLRNSALDGLHPTELLGTPAWCHVRRHRT